jgi:hypothetical protein
MQEHNWGQGHSGFDNRRNEELAYREIEQLGVEDYERALRRAELTEEEEDFLRYVLRQPAHVITTVQAAKDMNWKGWQRTNRVNGSIAEKLVSFLPVDGKAIPYLLSVIYRGLGRDAAGRTRLQLREPFAAAVAKIIGRSRSG